jgi:hypothetical protein
MENLSTAKDELLECGMYLFKAGRYMAILFFLAVFNIIFFVIASIYHSTFISGISNFVNLILLIVDFYVVASISYSLMIAGRRLLRYTEKC